MTTHEAIETMRARLGVRYDAREAAAMARVIMEEVLGYSTVDMALWGDREVPTFFPARMDGILSRLEQGEPLQYVLGVARFHGHNLRVTPATLIPRPETEQLVDMIVDAERDAPDLRVLDMGTGSGCIAVSLALALRFAQVTGIDISDDALAVARDNARTLNARVTLERADMLRLPAERDRWDVIVSNPPYVCESERDEMDEHVLAHEPATALFVPDDEPLRYYRAIARYAATALTAGGRLYLEINRRFGTQVAALLSRDFDDVAIHRDLYNNPRFATARKPR